MEDKKTALRNCEEYSVETCCKCAPTKCEVLKILLAGLDSLAFYDTRLLLSDKLIYLGIVFDNGGINAQKHVAAHLSKTLDYLNRLRVDSLLSSRGGSMKRLFDPS